MSFIVGIAGGSGSGKTTICRQLVEQLDENAAMVSLDSYYRDQSHRTKEERDSLNFDHPAAVDFDRLGQDLTAFGNNETVQVPTYCFESHERKPERRTIEPKPILIVEGVLLFVRPDIRERFDLRLFVDADETIRLQRRLQRDKQQRARTEASVVRQWQESVVPMYDQFVRATRMTTHLVIDTGTNTEKQIRFVAQILAQGVLSVSSQQL